MSKIKELAGKTASIQPRNLDKPVERSPRTAPVMMYDATARMHAAEQRAEELEARLRAAEKQGSNFEVLLDDLHEVAGRKRSLTPEQFDELRENLRSNDLVTPITVRARSEGGYEIVSGHNRVEVFRELGRTSIAAVVRDSDAAQADINAFYANLLQPTLPDYEKYLGFKLIRNRRPELSQEQIATMAGVSQASVSRLLSFDELPDEAHEILATHPDTIGAAAAATLAGLAKSGKEVEVVAALHRIVEDGIDQASAIAAVAKPVSETPKEKPNAEVTKYKIGKAALCTYRKVNTTLRVDFKSPEHANAVHDEIQKVLERYAASLKVDRR